MTWSMITAGDWRSGTPASEVSKMVSLVNSSGCDLFIGLGDYSGNDVHTQITSPTKYFIRGNHDGSCAYCTEAMNQKYIANFKGVQIGLGGYDGSGFDFTQINANSPVLYFQHINFVDGCAGSHGDQSNGSRAKQLKAIPTLVGAGCGHNHNYATFFGTDRVFMQSGTSSAIRYCGPAVFMIGYWEFDDSVAGKLTVRYKGIDSQATFVKPTSWDKTFTVNSSGGGTVDKCIGLSPCTDQCYGPDLYYQKCDPTSGLCVQGTLRQANVLECGFTDGGGGGCVNCDLNSNYCLMNTCIPKKYVLYAGAGLGAIILIKMMLGSRR